MKKLYLSITLTMLVGYAQNVSPTINETPSRQFGQATLQTPLTSIAPNLVEGRELNSPFGIAFDTSVSPAILYVADAGNNRVLAFKNPNNMTPCHVGSALPCGGADLVIGQHDMSSTLPGGPSGLNSSGLSSGFDLPTSIAVDKSGNVYVLDSGNNRILRFPAPFKQSVSNNVFNVDLVIGQKTLTSSGQPNQGNGATPSAISLYLSTLSAIALDPGGNLWVTDTNNNRAVRFPLGQLAPNTTNPQADFVLGQSNLTTGTIVNPSPQPTLNTSVLYLPRGLAIDSAGDIYITDNYQRLLYFTPPQAAIGNNATRVLGLCAAGIAGQTCKPPINNYSLTQPLGVFVDGSNHVYVADVNNGTNQGTQFIVNRIAEYDVPANWPAAPPPGTTTPTVQYSPPIMFVYGQGSTSNFNGGARNNGAIEANASGFDTPVGGAFNGNDMWVIETGNNRVVGFSGTTAPAIHLIGQVDFMYSQPNLIEGRELFLTSAGIPGGDSAVDHSAKASAPHLYVADSFNNRVLGFFDARNLQPGQKADIVIGQSDEPGQPGSRFYRGIPNDPKNDSTIPTQTGLNQPSGVIVDSNGDLFVADTGNGRVLRFPGSALEQEFKNKAGTPQTANLVLGQSTFNSSQFDASQSEMRAPYGLALLSSGSLVVSDLIQNRVLVFKRSAGQDFAQQAGLQASAVIGQASYSTTLPGAGAQSLNNPRRVSTDSDDLVYVADAGNNRLMVFPNPLAGGGSTGTSANFQLNNLDQPQGVVVNQVTGEIWVTMVNNVVWRLPPYQTLSIQSNPNAAPYTQQLQLQTAPFSISLDNSANPILAEVSNRVTFFYPKLTYRSPASYAGGDGNGVYFTPLAPGQLALLFRVGAQFSPLTDFIASTNPWPQQANDYQITVNGVAAPIYQILSSFDGEIAFQVPYEAPASGTANFLVTHPSTGEIVGAGNIPMAQYAPAFFTANAQGTGQVAARNPDFSANGPANPVAAKDGQQFISFYLTGGGVFNNAPQDGFAPSATCSTHDSPILVSPDFGGGGFGDPSLVQYSGCGGFAGGYQINMTVPGTFAPGPHIIAIQLGGIPSNVGPSAGRVTVTFYTK